MMFGHVLSHLDSISRNLIFQHHEKWPKRARVSKVPMNFRISNKNHSKEHQKQWEYTTTHFVSWIVARDIVGQRGVRSADRRNPP